MWASHSKAAARAGTRPARSARLVTVALIAVLLSVTGVLSIAAASPGDGGGEHGRTLVFRTTLVSSSVNDAGHGGVADVAPGVIDRTFHLLPRHTG